MASLNKVCNVRILPMISWNSGKFKKKKK